MFPDDKMMLRTMFKMFPGAQIIFWRRLKCFRTEKWRSGRSNHAHTQLYRK